MELPDDVAPEPVEDAPVEDAVPELLVPVLPVAAVPAPVVEPPPEPADDTVLEAPELLDVSVPVVEPPPEVTDDVAVEAKTPDEDVLAPEAPAEAPEEPGVPLPAVEDAASVEPWPVDPLELPTLRAGRSWSG